MGPEIGGFKSFAGTRISIHTDYISEVVVPGLLMSPPGMFAFIYYVKTVKLGMTVVSKRPIQ